MRGWWCVAVDSGVFRKKREDTAQCVQTHTESTSEMYSLYLDFAFFSEAPAPATTTPASLLRDPLIASRISISWP